MAPWPEKVFVFPFYCPTSIKFGICISFLLSYKHQVCIPLSIHGWWYLHLVSDVRNWLMQPLVCLAKHTPLKMLGVQYNEWVLLPICAGVIQLLVRWIINSWLCHVVWKDEVRMGVLKYFLDKRVLKVLSWRMVYIFELCT